MKKLHLSCSETGIPLCGNSSDSFRGTHSTTTFIAANDSCSKCYTKLRELRPLVTPAIPGTSKETTMKHKPFRELETIQENGIKTRRIFIDSYNIDEDWLEINIESDESLDRGYKWQYSCKAYMVDNLRKDCFDSIIGKVLVVQFIKNTKRDEWHPLRLESPKFETNVDAVKNKVMYLENKCSEIERHKRKLINRYQTTILNLHERNKARVAGLAQMIRDRAPLKARSDWTMPEPPFCPECGDKSVPAYYVDCDEVILWFECKHGRDCYDSEISEIPWPFEENQKCIADHDLEPLGFVNSEDLP